jgi:hypothetical protein
VTVIKSNGKMKRSKQNSKDFLKNFLFEAEFLRPFFIKNTCYHNLKIFQERKSIFYQKND